MDEEILKKIEENREKLDKIYVSTEKTRKYFMWTLIITVVMFVLPLVGLVVMIPFLLRNLGSLYGF